MKSFYTQKAIKDVVVILVESGAMTKLDESKMKDFLMGALNRISTIAIDDYRKAMHEISYEMTEEINKQE